MKWVKSSVSIFLLMLMAMIVFAGCGSDPIEAVKNSSLAEYPNMPIAETFQKAYKNIGVEVTEQWDIVPDSELGEFKDYGIIGDNDIVVRCIYKAVDSDNPHQAYITYKYNQNSCKTSVLTVKANDSELMFGDDALEYIGLYFEEV